MSHSLTSFRALLSASLKMYFRNRSAVFFSLVFPLVLLAVFGFLSRSGGTTLNLDVTNHSSTALSTSFVDSLKQINAFKVKEVTEDAGADELSKGNTDLQVIVPESFGQQNTSHQFVPVSVITHFNQAKPQNGQLANLIVSQVVDAVNAKASNTPQIVTVQASGVQTKDLGFFDFILPGLLGMVIMQAGVFGVAFAFVSFKSSGSLRRIQATPVHPWMFVLAQAVTRLILTLLTIVILVGLGIKFFNFHMLGSWLNFSLIVLLGSLVFLGIGFVIAGYAKDENQVPPLANIVQLPMLFLSGIFFPRDNFPEWLKRVTDYFPLTYLADALRHISNEGMGLSQIGWEVLGLTVWCVIVFVVAVRVFRWE